MIKEEIESAGNRFGIKMGKLPNTQQEILTVMHQYLEGWINEDLLEKKMRSAINKKSIETK